ncbi:MAG: hypothetical protein KatS3mg118_3385 [Paracoccaceae bacterium]|nr:MAG: hypothetical protein KatS3mg118_3385 [Paracoccaceae bacterium]
MAEAAGPTRRRLLAGLAAAGLVARIALPRLFRIRRRWVLDRADR